MAESTDAGVGGGNPGEALLQPGERLGWVFRDRKLSRRPYPHPTPTPAAVPEDVVRRARSAKSHLVRNLAIAIPAAVVLSGLAVCFLSLFGRHFVGPLVGVVMLFVVAVIFGAAAALVWWDAKRAGDVAALPERIAAEHRQRYDRELAEWTDHKARFEAAEAHRSDQLPEWSPAAAPSQARRIDVVGGSLWGWEGLLTVFGSSTLASGGQLTVLDLSGEAVCRELAELAADSGIATDVQVYPDDLAAADLLAGLDERQFVDVLVEAVHGGDEVTGELGQRTGGRAERALDDRLLSAVCAAIGPPLTVERVVVALRELLGESGPVGHGDTPGLTGGLFSAEYRREVGPRLRALESFLHLLGPLGTAPQSRPPARLACVATTSSGTNARDEVLADLIVQRLTRGIAAGEQVGDARRTVIVVGADPIARRHLERLSDVCERRGVRLVYLFRHLREGSLDVVGAGAVGLMRMGNHQEATRAAEFVGREHTFVLSTLTHQLGGAETHTKGESEGRSESTQRTPGRPSLSRPWRALPGIAGSSSRTWRTTASHAQGTNWSEAATYQRATEYTVEPRILQGLPDYALLLITAGPQGPTVTAVECNPAIVTLPRVSLTPQPTPPPIAQPRPPQQSQHQHPQGALPPAYGRPPGV